MRQKLYKEGDLLEFGKHKGETVIDVLSEDAQYILWLDEQEICEVSDDILSLAESFAYRQKMEYYRENYDIGDLEF